MVCETYGFGSLKIAAVGSLFLPPCKPFNFAIPPITLQVMHVKNIAVYLEEILPRE
jgi:hypothetical protein